MTPGTSRKLGLIMLGGMLAAMAVRAQTTGVGGGSSTTIATGTNGTLVVTPVTPEVEQEEGQDLISITLDDVPLVDVVRMFTRISGANIIATSSNLQGTVTVNLTDVEWFPALQSILREHNLTMEKAPDAEIYSIVPVPPDAPEPQIVKTVFLQHTTVPEVSDVVKSSFPDATLSEFPSRNALVVKTTAANHGKVDELILEIDIPSKQVCIETKFMELSDSASKQLGMRWDSLEEFGVRLGVGPFESTETKTWDTTVDDKLAQWDRRSNVDTLSKLYNLYDVQYEVNTVEFVERPDGTFLQNENLEPTRGVVDIIDTGKDVTRDVVDTFSKTIEEKQAAILELDSLEVVLSALKRTDGVSIISNPKIIVASGSRDASFSVGTREPIIKREITRGTTESPGDKETAQLDTSISTDYIKDGYLRTGIELEVVPIVKTDDLIESEIKPSLRRKIGEKEVAGNTWPVISVKEIATRFTLRSGQTVAIGGLTDTSDSKQVSKIPLLGDIPLIGKYLFSHTKDMEEQVETIIFVTLSLAQPEGLREETGIPNDARLVHKKIIEDKARSLDAAPEPQESDLLSDDDSQ